MNDADLRFHLSLINIEILSAPALVTDRVNEDRWLVVEPPAFPNLVTFAVIDGAGIRIKLPTLVNWLAEQRAGLSASAYVGTLLKAHLSEVFLKDPEISLSQALIQANEYIRLSIEEIIGNFDPDQLFLEFNDKLDDNLRDVRLILPACVLTLARLNTVTRQLEYVHLGDTVLLEFRRDGRVLKHTTDQMGQFDQVAFEKVLALKKELMLNHFRDAVKLPEGRRFIIESGLRLNYTDVNGSADRLNGCGVINGMREMENYIESGLISIDPDTTLGFALLTDGLELPAPLYEEDEQRASRNLRIADLIQNRGLRGLYDEVVKMTDEDMYFDLYPRTKIRDDATGIYIQFGATKRDDS